MEINKPNLSVLIPSYREAENLRVILPRINQVCKESGIIYEVIVIDTVQPMDDTAEVCRVNKSRYINRRGGNRYGDAVRTGISDAEGEYVIFMDADGSHTPEFIPKLFSARTEADVVIASRYVDGGETDNARHLVLMSLIVNWIYSFVLNLPCKDVSNSFKLYRANDLKHLRLQCQNFDIVEEILFKLRRTHTNLLISELAYTFKKRMFGETKRNLFLFMVTYIWTLVRLRLSVFDVKVHQKAFSRFAVVGTLGFIVNLAVFTVAYIFLEQHIAAAIIAFAVAVTQNFIFNRAWSFSHRVTSRGILIAYITYVLVNLFGLLVNLIILEGLITHFNFMPIIAQVAGVGAGMFANYFGAHLFVFTPRVDGLPEKKGKI
ncbi:GtrA family protein [Candidatus Nomurabacteria bacterium]|nr:GtrA family protein [Candidatus Nomurabacteria bacterium]